MSIFHQVPDVHRSHYRHSLKTVVYGKDVRLFEFTVPTVVPLRANRPDLILVDDKAKTGLLNDVSVPLDCNINIKVSETRIKYAPLCIELKNLWGVQTTVIPSVVGALGCANGQEAEVLDRLGCGRFSIVQEMALCGTRSILKLMIGMQGYVSLTSVIPISFLFLMCLQSLSNVMTFISLILLSNFCIHSIKTCFT